MVSTLGGRHKKDGSLMWPVGCGAKLRRLLAGFGFVDLECPAVEVDSVELLDGSLRLFGLAEGHESEATGAAGFPVHCDVDVGHVAAGAEGFADTVFGGVERQIADVEFGIHRLWFRKRGRFSACSRNSDFGSTYERNVHLQTHQPLSSSVFTKGIGMGKMREKQSIKERRARDP